MSGKPGWEKREKLPSGEGGKRRPGVCRRSGGALEGRGEKKKVSPAEASNHSPAKMTETGRRK